ncbi:MAG: hypothetical protein Ct9H90mP13_01200 [Pseudomonadota bacterium]|nr:MAG: hypothetical protein Ct9H90mP13_01200 [Pseudomonadota bacterium]
MDRRTFTKLIGLLALPSKKGLGEVLRNPKIVVVGAGIIGTRLHMNWLKKVPRSS